MWRSYNFFGKFPEFLQIVLTVPILAAKFLEIKDCSTCAIYEAASESPPTVTPSFLWQKMIVIEDGVHILIFVNLNNDLSLKHTCSKPV